MEEQYRVLHLVSNSRWTGVAEPATSVALHQKSDGWAVWMACEWGRSMEERLLQLDVPLAKELQLPRRVNPLATLADVRRLRHFVRQHGIQVIHCHQLHEHWMAALALRRWQEGEAPLLVRTVHRYEAMRRDPWHSWLFAKATDLVITVSTEQTDLIRQAYPRARGNIETIYGGVNPDQYAPTEAGRIQVRGDMGEPPDSVVGGIVAHLGYNRGHRWLLEAAPAALAQAPRGVIWIIGKGEMKKELRRACSDPKYDGRLVMAGYRSDDLPETYSALDFAMLLGLGSEGSARAALEAMAAARPVIGINKGALCDTITHGTDGFLVNEGDVDALRDSLVQLMSSREKCEAMGKAARQKILERFTEGGRYEATKEAYGRTLRARQP